MTKLPALVIEKDRFTACVLQVERLHTYLRRRAGRHPDAREAQWLHWLVLPNGAILSERDRS